MTGFEYQVAVHLIGEGFIDEGLSIVRGIRLRYDGRYRNPFNEFECGNHYIRALANWGLVIALSGFSFNAPERSYGFSPRISVDNFRTFWSTATGWGTFSQRAKKSGTEAELSLMYGKLEVERLSLSAKSARGAAKIFRGKELLSARTLAEKGGATVLLDAPLTLLPGQSLKITFS
jgi:hypothetical protein